MTHPTAHPRSPGSSCALYMSGGEPWHTTSRRHVQAGDGASVPLSARAGALRLLRPFGLEGMDHRLVVSCYGKDLEVVASLYSPDHRATLGAITIALGASPGWGAGELDLSRLASKGISSRSLMVSIEAKWWGLGERGELFMAHARETIAAH